MTLTPRAHDAVRHDWAERFGCEPAAFEQRGVTLVDAETDRTVRLLRRGDATVVAANQQVRQAFASREAAVQRWPLVDATGLLGLCLGVPADEVGTSHGPAVLAYVDATSFTPVESSARLLEDGDAEAFDTLRERTPADEWARASPTFRPGRTAGLFRDDDLVAVATLSDEPLPEVGVVVADDARDEGIGQAVVSCVLEAGFERDGAMVPCYRTPESATASLSLAAALGFERWASEAVVVRE